MEQQAQAAAPADFVPMTDDQALNYTQQIRRGFIDAAIQEKVLHKGEVKEKALVMSVLSDMDRTALTNKRIKVEEKSGAINGSAALVVASMLARMGSNTLREEVPVAAKAPPSLPDTIPAPELVPGETDTAAVPMNYNSFMEAQAKRFGLDTDKK